MANIYQLKTKEVGVSALEADVRGFMRKHSANLVTRIETGNSFQELHETPGAGAYFYLQNNDGNVMPVLENGRIKDYCAVQLNLVGFDEQSDQFAELRDDVQSTLAKYFIR